MCSSLVVALPSVKKCYRKWFFIFGDQNSVLSDNMMSCRITFYSLRCWNCFIMTDIPIWPLSGWLTMVVCVLSDFEIGPQDCSFSNSRVELLVVKLLSCTCTVKDKDCRVFISCKQSFQLLFENQGWDFCFFSGHLTGHLEWWPCIWGL